ncbi:MAG: response regulator [Deltaproteobacteria bacterium]|nr:response regulator [Deltaproteobacteria bacterium]
MGTRSSPSKVTQRSKRLALFVAIGWTVSLAALSIGDIVQVQRYVLAMARFEARGAFNKDLSYLRWIARKGGLYVKSSANTPGNPQLKLVPQRVLTTSDGVQLKLVHPAYMSQQVQSLGLKQYGFRSRITSLKPMRPANRPDRWERRALLAFETGTEESLSLEQIEGREYLRFMRTLTAEGPCLKCHGAQGYAEGDVLGGISISVPMKEHRAVASRASLTFVGEHAAIWLLGLVGLVLGTRSLLRHQLRQQKHEQLLRDEHQRAQAYLEASAMMILALDRDGCVTEINRRGCEILGVESPDAVIGREWFSAFLPAEDRNQVREVFKRLINGEVRGVRYFENRILRCDGTLREMSWRNAIVYDEAGVPAGTLTSGEDITDRKRAEAQLREAQKMKAIGALAGGVAHDMNNVLAVVHGLGELLLHGMSAADPKRGDVEEILQAAKRGQKLTSDLLGFARKGSGKVESTNINGIVEDVVGMLRRTLSKKVELEVALEVELPNVDCDPSQMANLVMNLCLNAADAVGESGSVTIATRIVEHDPSLVRVGSELPAGRYVGLSVQDDGEGMDDATVRRAFEPFFTTKPLGEGAGLGLSMVYGVATGLGGAAAIESEQGQGTTVTVLLPASPTGTRDALTTPSQHVQRGHGATILVVDDEAMIRNLGERMLTSLGYRVRVASSGAEAIEQYAAHHATIDVVLLDLAMPLMDGAECYSELKKIDPAVVVVICTGHTESATAATLLADGAVGVVTKPFEISELAAALAHARLGV